MAKINAALIERIGAKLGIGDKAVYARIAKIGRETALERHLAALVLAMRNDVSIVKYSTAAERAEIRGEVGGGGGRRERAEPADSWAEPPAAERSRRPAKAAKKQAKKTKDNTVFVVHGRDGALRQSMFDFLRALNLHPLEWDHAID
ncbi:MAG: DNA-binding protein, partial [Beijerinckiaceae bacterium]|nr:DNA-binding protein [Beijerinckiaceae bacterium]